MSNPNIHDEDRHSAFFSKFPEFTISSHEIEEPSRSFSEPYHNREKDIRQELGLAKVTLQYHSTILETFKFINVNYKIIFPLPTYREGKYYIMKNSLACKIASILEISDSENRFEHYIDYLKTYLFTHSDEFFIYLIEDASTPSN